MREKQLNLRILIARILTIVIMVGGLVFWKFKKYDEVNARINTANAALTTAETDAGKLYTTLQAKTLESQKLALSRAQVAYFRKRYRNLEFNLSGPGPTEATWVRLLNEYFADYGLELRRQLIQAADEAGVVITTSAKVDNPPQIPEQVTVPPSGFIKPVTGGSLAVTTTGGADALLRFFERVNQAEILMGVGNVKLEGTTPNIKASFTITPYLVASGESAVLPAGVSAAPAEGTTPEGGAQPTPAPSN